MAAEKRNSLPNAKNIMSQYRHNIHAFEYTIICYYLHAFYFHVVVVSHKVSL